MVTYQFIKCKKVGGNFAIDTTVAEVSSLSNMPDGTFSVMDFWSQFLLCRNSVYTASMQEDYYDYSPFVSMVYSGRLLYQIVPMH